MFTCSGRRRECSQMNFELKQGNNIEAFSFSEFSAWVWARVFLSLSLSLSLSVCLCLCLSVCLSLAEPFK